MSTVVYRLQLEIVREAHRFSQGPAPARLPSSPQLSTTSTSLISSSASSLLSSSSTPSSLPLPSASSSLASTSTLSTGRPTVSTTLLRSTTSPVQSTDTQHGLTILVADPLPSSTPPVQYTASIQTLSGGEISGIVIGILSFVVGVAALVVNWRTLKAQIGRLGHNNNARL